MKKILSPFSYVFHPLLIPVYATLFYFMANRLYYPYEMYLVFIQVLILTILLPVSIYYLLKSLGRINSVMVPDNKQRRLPLAIHCVLLFILLKYSFSIVVIPELYYYFLGSLISAGLALFLIIFNYRASLHMMGITSFTIFIISVSAYYHTGYITLIAIMVLCCGFTASSRLMKKAHSADEIITGTLIGIIPQIILWSLWLLPVM